VTPTTDPFYLGDVADMMALLEPLSASGALVASTLGPESVPAPLGGDAERAVFTDWPGPEMTSHAAGIHMPDDLISSPVCQTYGDVTGRSFDVGELTMGLFSSADEHLAELEAARAKADPATQAMGIVFHVEQYHPDEAWENNHDDIDALFAWFEHSGSQAMTVADVIGGFEGEGSFRCP